MLSKGIAFGESGIYGCAGETAVKHAIINLSALKGRERESIIKSCHRHSRNEMMNRVWRGSNERRRKIEIN